jgi:hypothetical protein
MKKAYICMETYNCTGGVVFAKTNLEARKIAANEWNDGELGGLSVRRATDLDEYAETNRVPAWKLIVNHGWSWEDGCSYCGQSLNYDDLQDAGKDPCDVVGFDGFHVYCNEDCKERQDEINEGKDRAGDAFLSQILKRIKSRFGDVDIVKTHHFTTYREGYFTTEQAIVDFDFPGRKYGYASLRYSNDTYKPCEKLMPCTLHVLCSNGDIEAFEAFSKK